MNVVPSSTGRSSTPLSTSKSKRRTESGLNFYTEPPTVELSIDDFEVFALKRLKVLKKIEQLKMMRCSAEQYKEKVNKVIEEQGLADNDRLDTASHFILRLCYCQSEELRRWFLQHEAFLFQFRLKSLNSTDLARSVRAYAQVSPISNDVKEAHRDALLQLTNPTEFVTAKFYAVPFTQVLDLVSHRQCYLHGGQAYIPQSRVESILAHKFRSELSRHLALMGASQAAVSAGQSDDPETVRLTPLVQNLNRSLVSEEPQAGDVALSGTTLTAGNATQHVPYMPLCMRQLQTGLQKDKKLKHWGRLQYGLFLKGAGLGMEDALLFFQRHFSNITGEQFQKEYAYNIRHMYGREGKRATYTPYSCSRIVLGNAPSAGEHHGCPYKHYDGQHLGQLLQKLSIGTSKDRLEILSLTKSQQYQLACTKHFQVVHPDAASRSDVTLDNVGNHPNAWFRASVAYHKSPDKEEGEANRSKAVVSPEK